MGMRSRVRVRKAAKVIREKARMRRTWGLLGNAAGAVQVGSTQQFLYVRPEGSGAPVVAVNVAGLAPRPGVSVELGYEGGQYVILGTQPEDAPFFRRPPRTLDADKVDGKDASDLGGDGYGSFLGLQDTPDSYIGEAGKNVRVKATEDALEFVAPGTPISASNYNWISQVSNSTTSYVQVHDTVEIDIVIPSGKKLVGIAFVNAYMRVSAGRGVVSVGRSKTGAAPWTVAEAYGFGNFTQTSFNSASCAHRLDLTGDGSTYTFTPVFRQLDGGQTVYAEGVLQLIMFYSLVPV